MNQPQEQSLILLREKLIEAQSKGTLGVIAARSQVPEWVIRDWCNNPLYVPNRMEVQQLQDALDNKKRHAPQTGDAAADATRMAAFVEFLEDCSNNKAG